MVYTKPPNDSMKQNGHSTLTKDASSPEPVDPMTAVKEFFQYRPKPFEKAANHTKSAQTRAPASFDQHLEAQLRLCRVIYLPTITEDLQNIADNALACASHMDALPSIQSGDFPTDKLRQKESKAAPYGRIVGEPQIKIIYEETTSKFCTIVASTLQFQLPRWSSGHLEWSIQTTKTSGIADGFLRLNQWAVDADIPSLPDDFKNVAEDFPTIGIWEFKNLIAGSERVFEAIVQQSSYEKFDWEGCEHGVQCPVVHPGQNGGPLVTGWKKGFDAEPPICQSTHSRDRVTPPPLSFIKPLTDAEIRRARHMTQQVNMIPSFQSR
jgi:hypothetical protein